MMLAHWWDAEHWQGDCVYFYTFLLLTFLLLFSPFFFLFPRLLALGHVVDSSNAKHIGGKEHVVLIKKRLSQAIYLFVWKLLLHFTDNMEKKTRDETKKLPCNQWREKMTVQSPFHCLPPVKQKLPIPKSQLMVCANCSGHSCQKHAPGWQHWCQFWSSRAVRCHGHDVSSLAGCWTLARRLCLIFYLFLADRAFSVLSLLSVFLAFALGVCAGLSLHESSKVIVFLQFWQKCANVRQTLTFPFSSSIFRSSLSSLSASSTC